MERLPRYENCFFCGPDSKGLRLRIEYGDHACSSNFVVDDLFQGFRGVLHGGIVSGILDEIMWWAVFMETGILSATWKLDVEFRKTVLCGKAYRAVGIYERAKHGNYHVSARIEDDSGTICASALGIFRGLKETDEGEFFRNLDFSESSEKVESLLRSRLKKANPDGFCKE